MATTFPTTIDTFTDPTASDTLNSATVPHDAQHTNLNDAMTAVQTAILGIRNDLAISKIVPGATSWSLRNNADSTDNLIITDAGSATLRGTLSLALAASRIVPGVTSFSLRNHANTATSLSILDSGIISHSMTVPDGVAYTTSMHVFNTTFATQSAPYATSADATRGYDFTFNTDASAQGYAGILNTLIAHLNVNGTGGTIYKGEVISGVLNIKPGSTTDLSSGTYVTDGEILHNSTQNITGTVRAVQGSSQINSSGGFTTMYGGEFVSTDTLGQTGVYSNLAQGVRGYVEHNATTTWGNAATGASGEVFHIGAGTVTGITTGVQGWIHNTGNATYTGVVNAVWGLTAITGAAVTSGAVYGIFANLTFAGTAAGGTSNTAMNSEIRWTSSTNPAQNLNAMNARWRVENATLTVVGKAIGLVIAAPVVTNTAAGVITNAYGIQINNQGTTASVTSTGLRIEAQAGSGTANYAINSLGGRVSLVPSDSIASASGAVWAGFNIPATTATISGSTNITTAAGFNLAVLAQPTLSAGTALTVTNAATLQIANAPIGGGAGPATITNAYAFWVLGGTSRFDALILTKASAAGGAGLNLPHGAAPTSPVDGDVWTTTVGIFTRINGVTKTITIT